MGFVLVQFVVVEERRLDAVHSGLVIEFIEACPLMLVRSDDDYPKLLDWNAVFETVILHSSSPLGRETGLQRAGRVIEPWVKHT